MQIRAIEKKDIPNLIPLFDKVYPGVSLEDELDYFDELNPKDWLLIEEDDQIVGYARHFPDSENNFAPVEYYILDNFKNDESTYLLLNTFCNKISSTLNPRFQVRATDNLEVQIISQYFPHTVRYCHYEIRPKDIENVQVNHTSISIAEHAESISEILTALGNYPPEILKELIFRKLIYSYIIDDEVIGACYIHPHRDLEMEMLSLKKDQQSKGHGKTFLKELFCCFKALDVNKVFLKVKSTDFGIISLYQKCGMTHINEKDELWFSRK